MLFAKKFLFAPPCGCAKHKHTPNKNAPHFMPCAEVRRVLFDTVMIARRPYYANTIAQIHKQTTAVAD